MSPLAAQPQHVPDAAVYDFDMFLDPALLSDPHERVRGLLREAPPVFWTPRNGGHWVVTGHQENFEASRDTESFSSEILPQDMLAALIATLPPEIGYFPQAVPINRDPPEHGVYRQPLLASFAPKSVNALREEIRTLAAALIDAVKDKGGCDFIPAVAEPLPVQVFLKMMGLPLDRASRFRQLVHEFLASGGYDLVEVARRTRNVADAMADIIKARRQEPRDDLISLLWRTEVDGEPMSYERMEDYCTLLFIAGLDTVINGMGFGVRHLAKHPEFQDRLRADPSLIKEAAEELLRRYTFTIPTRRVARDVQLGGWTLKDGDRLMIYLPGADLDERAFERPELFDMDRKEVHVAFGVGPHRCLGSHLARVELQVLYEEMLSRLPAFRLDEAKPATFHAGNIIAIDSLPLRWD